VIQILVDSPAGGAFVRRREPVRLGVPIGLARVHTPDSLVLVDSTGAPQLLQTRVLDRWHDGSVRWLLLDFLADWTGDSEPAVYRLEAGESAASDPRAEGVAVAAGDDVISISTGPLAIELSRRGRDLFRRVVVGGVEPIDAQRTRLVIEGQDGPFDVTVDRATVEDRGPVRAVVRIDGIAQSATRRLQLVIRIHAFAASSTVRFEVTVHNPARALHQGGFWELGEPASALIRDASLHLAAALTGGGTLWCAAETGEPPVECGASLELFQASSGGTHWSSLNHVERDGRVPLPFGGYRLKTETAERIGGRATPIVARTAGDSVIGLSMPHFWQNFPKAIEGSAAGLTLRLFPQQHPTAHELQPGEQKTHAFYVAFGAEPGGGMTLEWTRLPLFARTTPEQYTGSGAFPYLMPLAEEPDRDYAGLVSGALDPEEGFEAKRELIDEFGWRHFGDMYADHERAYYTGPSPVHSHYNNQYDAIAGLARQFARSGDYRWWRQCCELASHVVDIDIYRTTDDKAAYNQGLFWHTGHYVDAGRSTHRSYPRAEGVGGGGPSAEHNYATGLVLHYFLTGEPLSRETALGLARWVLAMDDGTKTAFRWLSRTDTGLASATYSPTYQGPGRGAGHSIAALMDGYRLTDGVEFLDKAEEIIRRCIHPNDDIGARQLLDIERRWSYTIFLHALGRYLDDKALGHQWDQMYAYARQSLLAYARWMAEHERPYLDRPEQLEFPTETWMAQELWKSEVFTYAAKYAGEANRAVFLERAEYFFKYAIASLKASPTRTMTRPVVLLLSRGQMHGYVFRRPEALDARTGPDAVFGRPPRSFVPQKVRAFRRAIVVAVTLAGVCLGAGAWWLL
jgi:hypothetical protein